MHIFFTGAEAKKSKVPFLLDASMQPITAANAWLQELALDGATSSPCSWKTYAYWPTSAKYETRKFRPLHLKGWRSQRSGGGLNAKSCSG